MNRRGSLAAAAVAALLLSIVFPVSTANADHLPPTGYFTDDDGNIHENSINALAAAGITKGCNPPQNDRFCPSSSITRGEMATFLTRALNLPPSSTDFFTDDNDSVHESSINALRAAGITSGCRPSGEEYCPNSVVTRGQMAAFLDRGFSLPASSTNYFVDDDNSIFESNINALAEAKITVGCGPATFCVTRAVTRAEMATFLTRAVPLTIPLLHDTLLFSIPFSGVCDAQQTVCNQTINTPVLDEHFITEGWYYSGPFADGDEERFAAATFTVTLDGNPVTLDVGSDITSGGTVRRTYSTTLGKLSVGSHTMIGQWIWDGSVLYRTVLTIHVGS